MMKIWNCFSLSLVFASLVSLTWTSPARADFAAGAAAYDAGDYATAFKEWHPLAASGEMGAQRNLGTMYRLGQGVEKNATTAVYWYKRAAEQDFDRAQVNLGHMYLTGEGVKQDYKEARNWFEKAALMANPLAQYNLGLIHERGLGVDKNEARAIGWYYLAAKAGHTGALDRLAGLIAIGPLEKELGRKARLYEVPATSNEAKPEGTKAATPQTSQPSAPARSPAPQSAAATTSPPPPAPAATALATTSAPPAAPPSIPPPPTAQTAARPPATGTLPYVPLTGGNSLATTARPGQDAASSPDFQDAYSAYRAGNYSGAWSRMLPLARNGMPDAQYFVGLMYRDGQGVPADRVRAYAWWSVAARTGHPGARDGLGALAPWMTRGQMAEAEDLIPTLAQR